MISLFDAYSAVLHAGSTPETLHTDPTTLRHRAGAARADVLAGAVKAIGAWFTARRAKAAAVRATRALGRLDDRMLADIGISRGQIPYLVIQGAVGRRAANDDQRSALGACA